MNNYQIKRFHVEALILSCFLNQNRTLELDKLEFETYKLPFELFKASNTTKMIAKAIKLFQDENKPIDDILIQDFIESKTDKLNVNEYLEIMSYCWCSFDTMISYLNVLKEINKEDEKRKLLDEL